MNYSSIRFFIGSFFCILLLGTFSQADYLDTMKSTYQSALARLQAISENTKQGVTALSEKASALGAKTKKFFSDASEVGLGTKIKTSLRKKVNIAGENAYAHEVASVRVGNDLSVGERDFLLKREPKVRSALEKMFEESLAQKTIPTISIVMSGGGYRAMLGAIGFLLGAEKIGLLSATTYLSTLSGSTWAVAPWIATGMSLTDFKEYVCQEITKNITVVSPDESGLISSMLGQKIVFREPITSVDIYGALLANRLLVDFGERRQLVRLSDLHERIRNADYPYPLFTAIDARMRAFKDPAWFEFTPHEIGCAEFGAYIPTWAYGRKFDAGTSVNFAPEQSLGFQLGTFGSAFGVHVEYMWDQIAHKLPNSWFKALMTHIVKKNAGKRAFWAALPNYMFGMKKQEISERTYLKLVDAGLAFNLPYPPVSGERVERKSDIILLCDMSATGKGHALLKAEQYARSRGLKFPVIDYTDIHLKTMSIFKDDADSSVPLVIYMPRFADQLLWQENKSNSLLSKYRSIENFDVENCVKKGFCSTYNFQYSPEQSQKLIDLMEFNVMVNKDAIIEAIYSVVERKNQEGV
jgi:phospholipase A2